MKKKVLILLSLLLCLLLATLSGCEKKAHTQNSYQSFEEDYQKIANEYKISGFSKIGNSETQSSVVAFPENNYFDETHDYIDGDVTKPVKRNLYYINGEKTILIYISHMYIKDGIKKTLITYDEPQEELSSVDKNIKITNYSNYYMGYNHTMVTFKVINLKNMDKKKFEIVEIKAFQNYANILEK